MRFHILIIAFILFLVLVQTLNSFTYDEKALNNCLCRCGCTEEGWKCGAVVCIYDPQGTFDSYCSDVSKGECVCSGFGCGRASMPSSGECYEECYKEYGPAECGNGVCETSKGENCANCNDDCSCPEGKTCNPDYKEETEGIVANKETLKPDAYGCIPSQDSQEEEQSYTVCEQFCEDSVLYVPSGRDEYGQCLYETYDCENGCDDFGTSCYVEKNPEKCESYCEGNTLYYDGFYKESEGVCYYYKTECPDACKDGKCVETERTLDSVEIYLDKKELVLNGRDYVKVEGKAYGRNSEGKRLPYTEKELSFTYYITSDYGKLDSKYLKLSLPSEIKTDDYGRFEFTIESSSKLPENLDLGNAKLVFTIEDQTFEINLYDPYPKIKSIKLLNTPSVWEGSYGTFEVVVEDKDDNLAEYEISSKLGNIRIGGMEWGEKVPAIYNSCRYHKGLAEYYCPKKLNFAWKAPENSEKLALEYISLWETIKKKAPESIRNIAVEGAKSILHPVNQVEVSIVQEGYNTYKAIAGVKKGKTAIEKQAQEMGEAYEKGNWYFFEFLARTGVMTIEAYEMVDGFFSINVPGKGSDVLKSVKNEVKGITLSYLKDNLNAIADTYKAARAEKVKIPVVIRVKVTDDDGYSDEKGILFEVEGYESVLSS